MDKKLTDRQKLHKVVVGALRDTMNIHKGIITRLLIGSAAKRIVGHLLSRSKNDSIHRDAK